MLLSLGCWTAFDGTIRASELFLLGGDLRDGIGVEGGIHSNGFLMKRD